MQDRGSEERSWGSAAPGHRLPGRIKHHPSSQRLADWAIVNVSPGVALAVGAHVALCPRCRLGEPGGAERAGLPLQAAVSEVLGGSLEALRLEPWVPREQDVAVALAPDQGGLGEAVYLVRAAPGADIGQASLEAAFMLLVLEGAVQLRGRRFDAGDLVEFDGPPGSGLADPVSGVTLLVVADAAPGTPGRR